MLSLKSPRWSSYVSRADAFRRAAKPFKALYSHEFPDIPG